MKPILPPTEQADPLAVRDRVLAEAARFRARLPSLLPAYSNRWVVFRDGEVISAHDSEEDAYVAGLERFGPDGGHVVAVVREAEVVILSALTALGL
jgi:hypothetical protein